MLVKRISFLVVLLLLAAACVFAQTIRNGGAAADVGPIRSSPAYAEILLRSTELQAETEALGADYTEENPKIIDLRFEIKALEKARESILAVNAAESGKLTLALGKLMVRRAGLETELSRLQRSYKNDHPEVKRARRRLEVFDAAIKEILP